MSRRIVSEASGLSAVRHYRDADLVWIGAANASVPPPPRSEPSLGLEQALELAVLGIAMARPLSLDRVAELLRRILSPPLQPTLEVVETRVQDLARRGLVIITAHKPGRTMVRCSASGIRYARTLLRLPSPPQGAPHHDVAVMLKVCMLDVLADGDRAAVVAELRRDLQASLVVAEEAARHCRSTSSYARLWLDRQVSRLRDDLRWLEGVAAGSTA
jgi:Putative AphA-like transcriptional regulator